MKKRILDSSNCSDIPEKLMPIVNFNSCGGKEDCVKILEKNGFIFTEIVQDEEIGDAWLWTLPKK